MLSTRPETEAIVSALGYQRLPLEVLLDIRDQLEVIAIEQQTTVQQLNWMQNAWPRA